MRPNPTAALIAAVALAVAMIAAVVGLDVSGNSSSSGTVLGFGSPLVVALLAVARVDLVTAGQNQQLEQHGEQLAQITRQTNGVLDQRIRDGVRDVLADAGLIPTAGQQLEPEPPPAPPTFSTGTVYP